MEHQHKPQNYYPWFWVHFNAPPQTMVRGWKGHRDATLTPGPGRRIGYAVELEAVIQYVQPLHAIPGAMKADIAAIRNMAFDDRERMESYQCNLKLTLEAAGLAIEGARSALEGIAKDMGDAPHWQNSKRARQQGELRNAVPLRRNPWKQGW